MRVALAALAFVLCPVAGLGLDLSLPGSATLSHEIISPGESYLLPTGPYADGAIPSIEVEGELVQQAWRLEAQPITTLQMMGPLRSQLLDAGYEFLLNCRGAECGGFDFRFGTRVLPAPDMYVDLLDYRFVSAHRTDSDGAPDYVSILVSRSGPTGYIQVIHMAPKGAVSARVKADPVVQHSRPRSDQSVAQALYAEGHVILSDLSFKSGSSELGDGPFATLSALAELLNGDGKVRIALVGHTDTVGGLGPNIELSKRRATSVLERLVSAYDVPRAQLEAGGMGYLSPVTPNLTKDGREANRRVEAVLLNTEE